MADLHIDAPTDRVVAERYRLVRAIGRGASAQVYEAADTRLRRPVAIKLLHPGLVSDPRFVERFRHEAQLAAQLSHPNLLAVYDWGDDDGVYIVTELLECGSLAAVIASGHRLSLSQALGVGLEASRGLAYAHGNGLVHRDIKPANLLFGNDGTGTTLPTHRLRIADFGIARAVAEAAWTEPEGGLVGTARYAAPEQAGGRVTGAADVYSLSLTLIEAVTGTVPLAAAGPLSTMVRRQRESVDVPAEMGPLVDVLSDAGRVDPETRPTASEFASRLTEMARTLPRPEPLPIEVVADNWDEVKPVTDPTSLLDATRHEPSPVDGAATESPSRARPSVVLTPNSNSGDDVTQLGIEGPPTLPAAAVTVEPDDDDPEDDSRTRWGRAAALGALFLTAVIAVAVATNYRQAPQLQGATPVGNAVGSDLQSVPDRVSLATFDQIAVRQDDTVEGDVLAQLPPGWWPAREDGRLTIWVSEGPATATIPNLVGQPAETVVVGLSEAYLEPGEVTNVYDEEVPEGAIVATSPEAGTVVDAGSVVDFVVSDGPEPREVPLLVDIEPEEAAEALEAIGLTVGDLISDYSEEIDEGFVITTEPEPGELVDRDSPVNLVVSKGPPFFEIPDVTGEDPDDATDELQDAGFVVVGVVGPPNEPVLRTEPSGGEFHLKGREITIYTRPDPDTESADDDAD